MNKKSIFIENENIKIMNDFTVIKKSTNEKYLLTNNLSLFENKKTDIVSIFKINDEENIEPLTFINYFFWRDDDTIELLLKYVTEYLK